MVHVRFDHEKVGKRRKGSNQSVPIQRYEESMHGQSEGVRRQFPVKLAWASTIHKVQGMTVTEIVYDMSGTFTYGQAYVALSRVTKLEGLHVKNFDEKKICCSNDVHEALQGMKLFIPTFTEWS